VLIIIVLTSVIIPQLVLRFPSKLDFEVLTENEVSVDDYLNINLYLHNRNPYRIQFETDNFIIYSFKSVEYTGSIMAFVKEGFLENGSNVIMPYSKKHIGRISINPVNQYGDYILSIRYMDYQKDISISIK